ncbi:MAG: arginine--tRNA ligase [bacterium]|nr:arginine--tRNA ligase [bacterium]
MTEWEKVIDDVAGVISKAVGTQVLSTELMTPPQDELGDLAFPCFSIAKEWKKNPSEIAFALAGKINHDLSAVGVIQSVKGEGPYLNILLKAGVLSSRILKNVEDRGPLFGQSDVGDGRELMLEYAQPNTHKELHVGHLRNLVLGLSLHRILTAIGWKVVPVSYHGDVGAHVAKCVWLLEEEGGLDAIPESYRTGKVLGEMYSRATTRLEERPELKDLVSEVQQKLEAGDPHLTALWEETRSWSIREMDEVFEELGVEIERRYFESEVTEPGNRIVDELVESGIATQSEGALIVDLEEKKLGVFLVRKSDGTSLYATKDLALAKLKFAEYPDIERSLHVVDTRQAYYFKQLFEVFTLMGFEKPLEFIGYDFVTLATGAMSSRKGNIVTYQDFRDEMLTHVLNETVKRHPDWDQDRIQKTAHTILLAGVKFGMLKQSREKMYTFDPVKTLSFEGETGPYVQYAVTRLASILQKASADASAPSNSDSISETELQLLDHPSEKQLVITIAKFPLIVKRAGENMEPAELAQWCIDMAHRVNGFYRDVKVLDAPKAERSAKLRLVASAQRVLLSGLYLLGIPAPKEM